MPPDRRHPEGPSEFPLTREEKTPERPASSEVLSVGEHVLDLGREREADAERAEVRVREIREALEIAPVLSSVPREAKAAAYIEQHLPSHLKQDTAVAKLHRGAMRAYVGVQEMLGLLSVEGREHIPKDGPFILVANHSRASDDKRIIGIVPRPVHIVTADFHFNMTPVSRWLLQALGEIEIRPSLSNLTLEEQRAILPRLPNALERRYYEGVIAEGQEKTGSSFKHRTFLRTTVAALLQGKPVLLFPEGLWVNEGHVMRKAYPGMELVAREYRRVTGKDLPIVPVGLDERHVRIGAAVPFTNQETTDAMMCRVAALLPPEARGYYKDQV